MRKNFNAILNFQKAEKMPIIEWATWWDKTIARWKADGLPTDINTNIEITKYLGLDIHHQYWISPRKPSSYGQSLYNRKHFYPDDFIDKNNLLESVKQQQKNDIIIWLTLEGFFWYPRTIMGIENHLYAFYDQPELMHEINEDLTNWHIKVLDDFLNICKPDFVTFAEDMSYNHGPMISKELFNEFIAPYYKRLMPKLKNIPVLVDTDGNINELIPWFLDLGFKGFLPLERQAGVDINEIRKQYPNLLMIGGFDKTIMHKGEAAIRQEFKRIMPVIKQGGYIPSVDHQTPPNVSLEDYKLYIKIFKELC